MFKELYNRLSDEEIQIKMEGFGVKEMSQIKLAVKAKLTELGAYVDEELPDYILVMVSNRRSKEQMKNDLSLFLGSHTESFTEWLHVVLQRLENFASHTIAKSKETPKLAEKSKSADEASVSSTNYTASKYKENQKDSKITLTRKASDPASRHTTSSKDVKSRITGKDKSSSMEEAYEPSPLVTHSSKSAHNLIADEDMDEDCLNIRHEGDPDFPSEDQRNKIDSSSYGQRVHYLHFPILSCIC